MGNKLAKETAQREQQAQTNKISSNSPSSSMAASTINFATKSPAKVETSRITTVATNKGILKRNKILALYSPDFLFPIIQEVLNKLHPMVKIILFIIVN